MSNNDHVPGSGGAESPDPHSAWGNPGGRAAGSSPSSGGPAAGSSSPSGGDGPSPNPYEAVGATRPSGPYTSVPATPAGYNFSSGSGSAAGPAMSANSTRAPATGPGATPATGPGAVPATTAGAAPEPPRFPAPKPAAGKERRRGPGWSALLAVTLIASLLGAGGGVAAVTAMNARNEKTDTVPTAIATGATTQTVDAVGVAPNWEAVTAAVANSVVSITVAINGKTSVGSGVIYDSQGHIITNHHVVAGASQIQVTLADGRIYSAQLTGSDPATDLAVIELENSPGDLTVAQTGDSDTLITGQDVMAIGNPLGLSSTVTTGIISALHRPVVTTQQDGGQQSSDDQNGSPDSPGGLLGQEQGTTSQVYTNAIQIDAAINPGNSGGPLFNETGQVIGITSSIASMGSSSKEAQGSIGIGFAIPVNLVKKVADQLISTGTATHAYLGVSIGDGGGEADGVLRAGAQVGNVESDSPAADAGIEVGDVITAIDGKATSQAAALTGFVRQYSAGDTVTLTVIRDNTSQEIQVTLAERKDS
ncbi:trypsin-like peptidase domain-containing protein [Actinomyces oricola]|uniref:trypsin-like peptidase domain-containing protein n=1 Tax=Actinomyces oricola TaxID=206043 RepID=UPI001F503BE2|nr:trypsin-like peptidase domain-containing protein [Actinomyces oricola]